MKKLSDYKNEEAVDLWADLLEPISEILTDPEVQADSKAGKAPIVIAKTIMKNHKQEASQILLRIDPEPLDGLGIVMRLVNLIAEIGSNSEIKSFFGYVAQETKTSVSSGSVTENTEASEN